MDSKQNKETWFVSRIVKQEKKIPVKEKKGTPGLTRELGLAGALQRLGESEGWNQKANNAFVYYSLPTFTSFGMAYEKRLMDFVNLINAKIIGIECNCKETDNCNHSSYIGRSIIIEGGIFENTNTLTEWFMNFYQQSPSINGLARENQVEIAKAGYAVATVPVWSPFGREERAPESD